MEHNTVKLKTYLNFVTLEVNLSNLETHKWIDGINNIKVYWKKFKHDFGIFFKVGYTVSYEKNTFFFKSDKNMSLYKKVIRTISFFQKNVLTN